MNAFSILQVAKLFSQFINIVGAEAGGFEGNGAFRDQLGQRLIENHHSMLVLTGGHHVLYEVNLVFSDVVPDC